MNNMNIDTNQKVNKVQNATTSVKPQKTSDTKFADELSSMSSKVEGKNNDEIHAEENVKKENSDEKDTTTKEAPKEETLLNPQNEPNKQTLNNDENEIGEVIDGLSNIVVEMNNKLEQTSNLPENTIKDVVNASLTAEGNVMPEENGINEKISDNNDKNIFKDELKETIITVKAPKTEQLPETMPVLNQVNTNEIKPDSNNIEDISLEQFIPAKVVKNIKEETKNTDKKIAQIDMEEQSFSNLEQENENEQIEQKVKTVTNSSGIKKVDTKTNITVETIAKFDEIAMTKNDVEFFAKLVENNGNNLNAKEVANSSQVSKTLADMLAKSMNDNKPIRINFDNDISVIIKISKDGKISADFLPSSQIAEAYLKENLPLLKQRFDDNNINYDELNHREQKQNDRNDNRKKGRKDE